VHLIGATIFAYPVNSTEQSIFSINIEDIPAKWNFYCTAAQNIYNNSPLIIKGITNLDESLFIISDSNPVNISLDNNPVYLFSSKYFINSKAIVQLIQQSLLYVREFWNDTDPFYLINVTAFDSLDQGISYKATCVSRGITVGITENFDPASTLTKYLFVHELTHNWIGIKYRPKITTPNFSWFSEGFTDFIAWKILLDNKWITSKEYIDHYNTVIQNIHFSRYKNSSLSKMQNLFWKSNDAKQMAYDKGSLFAFRLNYLINKKNNKYTLKNIFCYIDKNTPITISVLSNAVNAIMGKKFFQKYYTEYIEEGHDIKLEKSFFGSEYQLSKISIGKFEIGFNWNDTTNIIIYVKKNSAAYKAGIRKGQKLMAHSIYYNKIDSLVELKIKTNESIKNVSYIPQKQNKIFVPKYINKIK
jgi:predicted metalloprotease with PDZ domain